jgi:hypothetical protein
MMKVIVLFSRSAWSVVDHEFDPCQLMLAWSVVDHEFDPCQLMLDWSVVDHEFDP